jgi:Arc/MetJ-type ribon-helix-helix transcriptional regulator
VERIAQRKLHFAPLERQKRVIERLLREGRFRNVTHFLRDAVDHYLDRIGRPPLSEQARQMAEDFRARSPDREAEVSRLQDASRTIDENW